MTYPPIPLARPPMAMAPRRGAPSPPVSTETAVKMSAAAAKVAISRQWFFAHDHIPGSTPNASIERVAGHRRKSLRDRAAGVARLVQAPARATLLATMCPGLHRPLAPDQQG